MKTKLPDPVPKSSRSSTKDKILVAAMNVIRAQGYAATTVDDLCQEAGVTKGAFFHHFESKEDLAVAAAQYWSEVTGSLFARASYHGIQDPLDRLLGYVEFRKQLLRGDVPEFTCLVGTMVQEAYGSNPAIREACQKSIFGHAETLVSVIDQAKTHYSPKAAWSSQHLALHIQAVIQGSFIVAKAGNDSYLAAESLDHLYRYIQLLFPRDKTSTD